MIDRLTPEQESLLTVWRDKWIEIGLSCEPLDLEKAKAAASMAYRAAGLNPPQHWIAADSPLSGALAAATLEEVHQAAFGNTMRTSVAVRVGNSVAVRVGNSVAGSVGNSVAGSVRDSVRDSVWTSVRARVWTRVGASVAGSVRGSVRDNVRAGMRAQIYGAHDAGWLAFYDFFYTVCKLNCVAPLAGLIELAKCCGWWAPYENAAILQHRHCELHRNASGQLHRDGGPAVLYRDGWGIWALNGVRVPQWLAETPQSQLAARKIHEIPNAEIRREFVRKIGVEKLLSDLQAEPIDQVGQYSLLELNLGDGRRRPYLKMLNPSVGVWHIEGVHPACQTVEQALAWRDGEDKYVKPDVLT